MDLLAVVRNQAGNPFSTLSNSRVRSQNPKEDQNDWFQAKEIGCLRAMLSRSVHKSLSGIHTPPKASLKQVWAHTWRVLLPEGLSCDSMAFVVRL